MSQGITLQDDVELRQLYARQSHVIDGGDGPGWAATYTMDGEFDSPTYGAPVRGRDALVKFIAGLGPMVGRMRHWPNNLWFEYTADGGITTRGYMFIVMVGDGPPRIVRSSPFTDDLVREDGAWRVRRRTVRPDPQ